MKPFYLFRRLPILSFMLLFFALQVPLQGFAQASGDPIILRIDGDLWAWEGGDQPLVQLTDWGYNSGSALSPDGTRVAYTSFARIFVDWLSTVQGAGGFMPPSNIWVLDLPTRETFRAVDQPENATYNGPSEPAVSVARTAPTWSPDSQQIAWIEFVTSGTVDVDGQQIGTIQLTAYDVVNNTSAVIATLADVTLSRIQYISAEWGRPGIFVHNGVTNEIIPWTARVYASTGEVLTEVTTEMPLLNQWLQAGDQDYLYNSVIRDTGTILEAVYDWQTGEAVSLEGTAEIVSATAPEGARFVLLNGTWHVEFGDQAALDLGESITPHSIAPDGSGVVYSRWELDPNTNFFAYTVIAHTAAGTVEIGRYQNNPSPLWGSVVWQVRPL